jgi:hypothetical protein
MRPALLCWLGIAGASAAIACSHDYQDFRFVRTPPEVGGGAGGKAATLPDASAGGGAGGNAATLPDAGTGGGSDAASVSDASAG